MRRRRARAGAVLAAYAIGLPAAVLIRSAVASFYARSDTMTPLIASLTAVAVNVALKIVLTGPYGVVGLALGTAIGIWVNLVLLVFLALRRDWMFRSGSSAGLRLVGCCEPAARGLRLVRADTASRDGPPLFPCGTTRSSSAILGATGALIYGGALLAGLKVLGVRLSRR